MNDFVAQAHDERVVAEVYTGRDGHFIGKRVVGGEDSLPAFDRVFLVKIAVEIHRVDLVSGRGKVKAEIVIGYFSKFMWSVSRHKTVFGFWPYLPQGVGLNFAVM